MSCASVSTNRSHVGTTLCSSIELYQSYVGIIVSSPFLKPCYLRVHKHNRRKVGKAIEDFEQRFKIHTLSVSGCFSACSLPSLSGWPRFSTASSIDPLTCIHIENHPPRRDDLHAYGDYRYKVFALYKSPQEGSTGVHGQEIQRDKSEWGWKQLLTRLQLIG